MPAALKRVLFWFALLLFTWGACELVSFTALSALNRSVFSYASVKKELAAGAAVAGGEGVSGRTEVRWGDFVEVLHPYFGFVADPARTPPAWDVSDYGFIFDGKASPITRRAPGRLVVAVFGGSFANGAYLLLKREFEAHAAQLHKEVILLNFSAGGYKQPQHLMVLNYLLALGAEFDLVINIDGFNEVALPLAENIRAHVNPFYPRGWEGRPADTISQASVRAIGRIEYLKERRADLARTCLQRHLYLSPTLCLIWTLRDKAMAGEAYRAEQAIRAASAQSDASKSYTMRGPAYTMVSEADTLRDLAGVWRNASAQMATLSKASGARYFHFLQPNQYVPNSKPLNPAERKQAFAENHPFRHAVVVGYPYLQKSGQDLQKSGVHFTDLTGIFAHTDETVYNDDCCHLNEQGYRIVAAEIYRIVQGE
ncbi:MAG: hypothetical protein JSR79_00285 [Proteobacteria bacterium]|nr:hypothetical protein [Pseudomonadota bacterium]